MELIVKFIDGSWFVCNADGTAHCGPFGTASLAGEWIDDLVRA